jgi:hypothetical protein
MKRINILEIETRWGYKAFELYQGDITQLAPKVDLLAVSVLADDYYPLRGTVIGALHDTYGIRLEDLVQDCEFDLRDAFCCWISRELPNPVFGRLLCVEMFRSGFSIEEVIQNVFVALSVLEAKGIQVEEFALPLLGTGSLGIKPASVIRPLLDYSLEHLKRSGSLRRIKFVAHDQERASQLDEAMNDVLGRVRVVIPSGTAAAEARKQILEKILTVESLYEEHTPEVFHDLRRTVENEQSRSFELGIAARRLVEFIANRILDDQQGRLFAKLEKIRKTSDPRVAEWITIYMHVLRVLGNEAAHESGTQTRIPPALNESDLELCLFCVCRLLDFWLDFEHAAL